MLLLQNNILKLRALEPEDLDLLYKWENNSAWWHVGNTINPFSKFILRQYIEDSKSIYEDKQLRLMIELVDSKQTIGMIDLYDYEAQHNRAGVGIIIDDDFQQKSYASIALALLVDYSFDFINLHSIYAHISVDNTASIHLFNSQGFKKTGLLTDWLRMKEEYVDIEVFQLVKE